MDMNTIWSLALSLITGALWFFVREKLEDVKRIERLLNITREEIARDTATKAEVQRLTDHIDQRFNRLEEKIDQLIQGGR
tara:strand:- start:197 stop:436 length:240 start_codon:yes stop_codon:yes gene_type:complete